MFSEHLSEMRDEETTGKEHIDYQLIFEKPGTLPDRPWIESI